MSEKEKPQAAGEEMIAAHQKMKAGLESALKESSVVLLAIEPGRGAVYTTREILGPMTREIEVNDIESKVGAEGLKAIFKEAAGRSESVAVTGFGGRDGSGVPSDEALLAAAEGVRAIAAAGGKAVVVAQRDLSDMDFGPAIFVGAMRQAPGMEISTALRSRLKNFRLADEGGQAPSASKPAGPG